MTELKFSSLFAIVALIIDQILMIFYNSVTSSSHSSEHAGSWYTRNESLKCRVIAQPSGLSKNKPPLRGPVIGTI